MLNSIRSYARWLHTRWPAGEVEKLPVVREDGSTNVPGLFVVGDLTGIPLLKLSANAGTRVARKIASSGDLGRNDEDDPTLDVAIIGGGTAGFAAAKACEKQGLSCVVFEASEPFSTIVNFPKEKPIYTYPTEMDLEGDIEFHPKSEIKEGLLEDLREQTVDAGLAWAVGRVDHVERRGGAFEVIVPNGVEAPPEDAALGGASWVVGRDRVRAQRVIVGIGRSGNYRRLEVPGEDKHHKVFNRLHDPKDYCGQKVLVVGGGDSAMETAIALTMCGAEVSLSYRREEFARPKAQNREKLLLLALNPEAEASVGDASDVRASSSFGEWLGRTEPRGRLTLLLPSNVVEIRDDEVDLRDGEGGLHTLPNDSVFSMIGREPPLDFFRKSGVRLIGEWSPRRSIGPLLFLLLCIWIYSWKEFVPYAGELPGWLNPDPSVVAGALRSLGGPLGAWAGDPSTLFGTIVAGLEKPAFYYTLAYSAVIVFFGIQRIRRRKTPYVRVQTLTLMAIQVVPLFILPVIVLPWLAANGVFDSGGGAWVERNFFPGESWWRAYGLILAWPLMVWNWFTAEPIWGWLVLGVLQTFVAIPAIIYFWGKGAYCGWICSCGAMAETLGDTQRHKMPHGPFWNRLNMLGQGVLALVMVMMVIRIVGWSLPEGNFAARLFSWMHTGGVAGALSEGTQRGALSYWWVVDLLMAGMLGYGLYFFASGRVWCRFACPLAALMHIYHRFSRFAILAEKKKCISCNVCTSVCHQGIDIMSFANKGEPMRDPQCVRCSACVQMCPTGVLSFGQVDRRSEETTYVDPDWLAASPIRMVEVRGLSLHGRKAETPGHRGPA